MPTGSRLDMGYTPLGLHPLAWGLRLRDMAPPPEEEEEEEGSKERRGGAEPRTVTRGGVETADHVGVPIFPLQPEIPTARAMRANTDCFMCKSCLAKRKTAVG